MTTDNIYSNLWYRQHLNKYVTSDNIYNTCVYRQHLDKYMYMKTDNRQLVIQTNFIKVCGNRQQIYFIKWMYTCTAKNWDWDRKWVYLILMVAKQWSKIKCVTFALSLIFQLHLWYFLNETDQTSKFKFYNSNPRNRCNWKQEKILVVNWQMLIDDK